MAPSIALFAILGVLALGSEACSHNTHFDFILFALQWPESFCETTRCIPHQPKWSIHGAWPENRDGSWPENCCTSKHFDISLLKPIEDELIASWESLKAGGTNSQFWSHEYEKHGTCAVESPHMKDVLDYFNRLRAWPPSGGGLN